ncbi:hypothetical protein ANCCAN_25988 [Ancylostoma caninum]|uniref:Uncharacterized protein n=1 Tax=Ancylostoma caninum TaxID=29170 RepID=A0A368FB88_ANCCA|nr:hypothetical protein ANCCAN_25988 [Ancylostoma caninum]
MPRAIEYKPSESQLENVLTAMVEQMRLQYKEMKTLFWYLCPCSRNCRSGDQQRSIRPAEEGRTKVCEEAGHTFAYWYKRPDPHETGRDAYRKYADDILPIQPYEIDFETTNLQKHFASKKTLIRRRYECLRVTCPPLTASYLPFRDYASKIKRMDEDALLKELDYTALRRLDTHAEDSALTIEDLVAECENFTALKMDNTDMEGSHEIHAVQKKKVKCFNCGGPHYRSTCPLLSSDTGQKMRQKPRRRSYRRKRSQYKNVVTFAAENARTYLDVTIRGRLSTNAMCVNTRTSLSSRVVPRASDENAVDAAEGISERRRNTQCQNGRTVQSSSRSTGKIVSEGRPPIRS